MEPIAFSLMTVLPCNTSDHTINHYRNDIMSECTSVADIKSKLADIKIGYQSWEGSLVIFRCLLSLLQYQEHQKDDFVTVKIHPQPHTDSVSLLSTMVDSLSQVLFFEYVHL